MKTICNKLAMLLYFIVGALILEAVTFYILGLGFMPEYFWYDFAIILFVAMLVYLIPNYTAQYIIYTIILLIQTIIIYVNYSLYTIYGDLFSFDMIRLIGEAGAAITTNFVYFSVILQLIGTFLAILVVGILILKMCKKDKINIKQHYSVFNVILILALQCVACTYFFDERFRINDLSSINSADYISSDTFLMNTSILKSSSYQKFGTYGYLTNLVANYFSSGGKTINSLVVDYFDSGSTYNSSEVFRVDEGNNVIVIMMESLEWFAFGDGTYDKDLNNLSYELTPNIYSIIYGDDYATDISNDNVGNDSLIATNFFAKSKTNISEGFGIMGNYPVGYNLVDIAGSNYDEELNAFGYTMPSVLRSMGYTTNYVHSHDINFYSRNETHYNLGFDNVIGKNSLVDEEGNQIYEDIEFHHWAAEGDFAQNAIDYIVPKNYEEKPFYTFYLNVSSHGAYDYNENDGDCMRYHNYVMYGPDDCVLDDENNWIIDPSKDEEDLTYTTWYQNVLDNYFETDPSLCEELLYYQCGVMGLDEAIGLIIDQLKEYDIYDETTILLYADHYAYYNNLSNRFKGIDVADLSNIELNTIPMIISSPGLKNYNIETGSNYTINDRFCSAYDVIPTLFDLLGVSFNENLYIGHSLFRPADYIYTLDGETRDMVVYYSNTGGLFSRDIYTYNLDDFTFVNEEENEELQEIFSAEVHNVLVKINFINLLNKYHLYDRITNI